MNNSKEPSALAKSEKFVRKWTMKYDDRGNLAEFKEWRKQETDLSA